jgi:hypothetical protein
VNKLKEQRLNDERQLKELRVTRKEATMARRFTVKLSGLSESLRAEALQSHQTSPNQTDGLDAKSDLLESLRLEVVADPQSYQFSFKPGGQIICPEPSQ